nr:acyltransferase domain-containing protein [Micromonospora provocatoris]
MSSRPKSAWVFPGQGAQRRGMGGDLFDRFPAECAAADRIIGVPVARLCRDDALLGDTRYAQPALFVVGALAYLAARDEEPPPDYLAGHSLGEYAALFAAGCLDFEEALRLVCRRGEIMSRAAGGGMLAVLGERLDRLPGVLADAGVDDVDVANDNADGQVTLSGPRESLSAAARAVTAAGLGRCVPLPVAAAFHSRYMRAAAAEFADVLVAGPVRAAAGAGDLQRDRPAARPAAAARPARRAAAPPGAVARNHGVPGRPRRAHGARAGSGPGADGPVPPGACGGAGRARRRRPGTGGARLSAVPRRLRRHVGLPRRLDVPRDQLGGDGRPPGQGGPARLLRRGRLRP